MAVQESALVKQPSRGRLFKIFTDLGPYFRKLQSTDNSFFFDCLEICVDAEKEPEQREFYGWWMIVTKTENAFEYERYDGFYNLAGDWEACKLNKEEQEALDNAFVTFTDRLSELIDVETGYPFVAISASE